MKKFYFFAALFFLNLLFFLFFAATIGKNIFNIYFFPALFLNYFFLIFFAPNRKIFLKINLFFLISAFFFIFFLNLKFAKNRKIQRQKIAEIEREINLNDEFFEKSLRKIDDQKIFLILQNWEKNIFLLKNNRQFLQKFLAIFFILSFQNPEFEKILHEKIEFFLPEKKIFLPEKIEILSASANLAIAKISAPQKFKKNILKICQKYNLKLEKKL